MRAAAGFHADLDAWFHVLLDLLNPAITLQPLAPNRALSTIDAMQLKDVLRKIHPNPSKLHFRPLPICDWNPYSSSLALDAVEWGGVHPIGKRKIRQSSRVAGCGRTETDGLVSHIVKGCPTPAPRS